MYRSLVNTHYGRRVVIEELARESRDGDEFRQLLRKYGGEEVARQFLEVQGPQPESWSLKLERTPYQIAEQIDNERRGHPVLWAPIQTGGETEGADIAKYLRALGVPYQKISVTRDRKKGKIYPHGRELVERIDQVRYANDADRLLIVCWDDVLSTGADVSMELDELSKLPHGRVLGIRVGAVLDRVGGADSGYAALRTTKPVFVGKEEMLALYRSSGSVGEFRDRVATLRDLYLAPEEVVVDRAIAVEERVMRDLIGLLKARNCSG
ncbi:MAG: hypothetical protein HYY37_05765 [Candidatus Aenigmarchaeota archaeon]|nr:hypothetical protein [Candidatus Aenigmarchaeota archaeon]